MRVDNKSMLLYVVTDRTWLKDNSLTKQVEETIKAGATFIQLREKDMQFDEFVNEAKAMKLVTDKYKVPFVINDNIDVCLACNADGVHIGQGDIEVDKARELLGERYWEYLHKQLNKLFWLRNMVRIILGWGLCFPLQLN